jgi:amino acid adenylation domain-containing protein/FkbH-like protein
MTEVLAFPTSFAQQRLWFLNEMEPPSAAYNIPAAVRMIGALGAVALDHALSEIIRRHESLRTTLANVDGQSVQVVRAPAARALPLIDLTQLAQSSRERAAVDIIGEQAAMPFDLERGPLFRVTLIRLSREDHITAIVMHHIISDGWSMSVLISEIASLYPGYVSGKPSPFQDLPIQYRDFAVWQRQWLSGETLEKELEYWRNQLAGTQPVGLPAPRDPGPHQDHSGAAESIELSRALTVSLKEMSRREGVTLFMLSLAVFKLLLSRYTGQTDLAVGTPIANRNPAQLEGLIGFFVNTLVLRSRISPDEPMRHFIRHVSKVALDAYAHQNVPFEKLVLELQPERDLSHNPLFDVMFNFVNTPAQVLELPGLSLSSIAPEEAESKLPLTLYAQELGETLMLTARYRRAVFPPGAITTLLSQLRFLLEQVAADISKPAGSYSLVSPETRHFLPDPSEPLDEPLYEPITVTFARVAAVAPGWHAITKGDRSLSYGQLAREAHGIALGLIASGIERYDVIAVIGPRSFGLITSMMSVLMSGGVLLTLDAALPRLRLQQMMSLSGARRVLYIGALRADDEWLTEAAGVTVSFLDAEIASAAEETDPPDWTALPKISPDDRCYLFFTSGTTGQPRAVAGCHKGLSHFLAWQRTRFGIGPEDRSAQLTALSFDVVLRDIFLPLTSGATLCLLDDQDQSRPDLVMPWLDAERISTLHTVPTLAETWLSESPPTVSLRSLRRVFFAGEPLRDSLVRQWRQTFPESGEIVNLYGPTETTLAKCFYVVPSDLTAGIQPVGRPLPDTQALVLNRYRAVCGVGEVGEIVIRTPFRTLGYLGDAEANAARFAINHFRDDAGDLLYFTGDSGRYRADGSLDILGRLDNQIKIRGVRVEPEEVAAVLSQSPLVASCVVVAETDPQGQTSLVAYVVPSQGEKGLAMELREYIGRRLPAVMAPSAFVFLDRLPLTPNGKVNMSALAAAGPAAAQDDSESVAPRTPIEEVLAAIWEDLLGVSRVSIHDNFFEVGGHSLLATRVASRLNKALDIGLPVRSLFERPNIADLAAEVQALTLDGRKLNIPEIRPVERGAAFPLSFAQQRLWVLDRLNPGSHAYNIPSALRFSGPLSVAALRGSLDDVIKRHEILRTTFPIEDGRPVQSVKSPDDFVLQIGDLQGLPKSQRGRELRMLTAAEAHRPFDLAEGPLLRATLLRLSPGEHVLLISLHHTIFDGWSRTLLGNEILLLYQVLSAGQPSPRQAALIQYGDFAIWQRDLLQGELMESLVGYWRQQLNGAPTELLLPLDRSRPAEPKHSGAVRSVVVNRYVFDCAAQFGRQNGASLFMTMLAGLKILLFKWTGQSDIVVGTVIANRNRLETEGLLGCFINFLPLRSRLSEVDSGVDVLKQTRAIVLEAYNYQDCPFDLIVEAVNPRRRHSANPIFNVAFLLQNGPQLVETSIENLDLTHEPVELQTSVLDLRFVARETDEGLSLLCEYDTDLFDPDTVDALLESYAAILRKLTDKPGASLSEYQLTDALANKARCQLAGRQKRTIAIASTFTAEPVEDALRFWTQKLGLDFDIAFAPFNQVFQQLLDPSSLLSINRDGVNVVLLRFEDWSASQTGHASSSLKGADIRATVEANTSAMASALRALADRSPASCIVCLCPASPRVQVDNGDAESVWQMEEALKNDLETIAGMHVVTGRDLASKYPVADYYDGRGDQLGRVAYTSRFYTALGTMVARKVNAINGSPYKVIALDCDDTLWAGLCGEDGPTGVTIDPSYHFLQEFMVAQHDAGMILCLCSKNNEREVLEIFDRRPDMVLKQEHVIARRINWNPKSDNLKALANELGLGLDSFIFIDDDPVECAAVRATCPEVLTLMLPERRELIPRFLDHVWAFDHAKVTNEDRQRTAFYRLARKRDESQQEAATFDEFLASLDLCVNIAKLEDADLDRASQLTYRTNQFNMTGCRRSVRDLRLLQESGRQECYVVSMSDRFGDYGIVGLLIFEELGEAIEVDTFLLSCRALGRNGEHRMLEWLGQVANQRGLGRVIIPYLPAARNQPALEFLTTIGRHFRQPFGEGFLYTFQADHAADAGTGAPHRLGASS